jgi:hypothetical protein
MKQILNTISIIIKAINKKIIKIQVWIFLTLIYYLVITPIGFFQNLLKKKNVYRNTYWQKIDNHESDIKDYYKQY